MAEHSLCRDNISWKFNYFFFGDFVAFGLADVFAFLGLAHQRIVNRNKDSDPQALVSGKKKYT
jgi:hypothetical protein